MVFKIIIQKNRKIICLLIILLIIFDLSLSINIGVAQGNKKRKTVSGFSARDKIKPHETISYHFSNNIIFETSTDTFMDFSIEYENQIRNREASIIVNNSNSIALDIKAKLNIESFGLTKEPEVNSQWRYRYNCVFQIKSNTSVNKITFKFLKSSEYGLDPNASYSIAFFESTQQSWQLLSTRDEKYESTSNRYSLLFLLTANAESGGSYEIYLESALLNLKPDTEYYITIFEVEEVAYDWIWWILISAIAILSVVILISKKDYIQYLKTRITPIEKGIHRLSLDDVLENENRNKIIEIILKEPGIHFNELLRKTELTPGNLVWHLDLLETYKIIGKKRIGNYIAYFPYYPKNPISNVNIQLQKSKLTLEILETIEEDPGIWNNLITKKFNVDHKTIHYHIKKLIDLGLIHIKKEGRKKKLYPNLDSDYFKNNLKEKNNYLADL